MLLFQHIRVVNVPVIEDSICDENTKLLPGHFICVGGVQDPNRHFCRVCIVPFSSYYSYIQSIKYIFITLELLYLIKTVFEVHICRLHVRTSRKY